MTTPEEQRELLLLLALQQAGVDNWSGYDIALDLYEDMLKEHGLSEDDEDDDGDTPEEPEPVAEPAPEPEPRSVRRLRNILGERYDDKRAAFWKRNYDPKNYYRALQIVQEEVNTTNSSAPARDFLERFRNVYVDLLYGDGAGETDETIAVATAQEQAVTADEPRSTRRLRNILGDRYNAEHQSVWHREYAPDAYDTSEAVLAWGTREYSRNVYLDQVFGKGAGDD